MKNHYGLPLPVPASTRLQDSFNEQREQIAKVEASMERMEVDRQELLKVIQAHRTLRFWVGWGVSMVGKDGVFDDWMVTWDDFLQISGRVCYG